MSKNEKIPYIEFIRVCAMLAVILLHVVVTIPDNSTPEQIGRLHYAVFYAVYMPTKWAVPSFIMISGALLLNPARNIDVRKITKYILRMVCVLGTFGFAYALMELVFHERTLSLTLVLRALLNTLEGRSWSHMWYVYMLISLYLLTIPLRYVIEKADQSVLECLIGVLIVGNFVIPTVNTVLGTDLTDFMVLDVYVTYYVLGYYLSQKKITAGKKVIIPGLIAAAIMIVTEVTSIMRMGQTYALNHQGNDILTLVQSISVFLFIRQVCTTGNIKAGKISRMLSDCGFCIYLIHPFFINLLYKLIGFTPLSMPIGAGIIVLFLVVLICSVIGSLLLKKIPLMNRII